MRKICIYLKKIFLILINIIIFSALFLITDFLLYNSYITNETGIKKLYLKEYFASYNLINADDVYTDVENDKYYRNVFPDLICSSPPPRSIVVFGCSFAYSWGLEKESSFCYKLAQATGRSVYNRAFAAKGVQMFPYILKHHDLQIVDDPEYFIFVYIDDHFWRLYRETESVTASDIGLNYKMENGKLKEKKILFTFLYKFACYRRLLTFLSKKRFDSFNDDEKFNFMKSHFLLAKKLTEEKFPNVKIVILKYDTAPNEGIFNAKRQEELRKEGFIVLDTYSLTHKYIYGTEYVQSEDKYHPNEKAWDVIVPAFVKELKL